MSGNIKKITVYLGSAPGFSPEFTENAGTLGRRLAEEGIGIIYGGACVGTMWAMADAALKAGGKVTGVFPENFRGKVEYRDRNIEVMAHGLSSMILTNDLDSRIRTMIELGQACIILPGSFGTMHELFTHMLGLQLKDHAKPVFILNWKGYYDPLKSLIGNMVSNGFMPRSNSDAVIYRENVDELIKAVLEY